MRELRGGELSSVRRSDGVLELRGGNLRLNEWVGDSRKLRKLRYGDVLGVRDKCLRQLRYGQLPGHQRVDELLQLRLGSLCGIVGSK